MVFVILLVWLLAWTPYVILHCWIMFFETQTLSAEMAIAPSLCCKLSAAVNSLLYGVRWAIGHTLCLSLTEPKIRPFSADPALQDDCMSEPPPLLLPARSIHCNIQLLGNPIPITLTKEESLEHS